MTAGLILASLCVLGCYGALTLLIGFAWPRAWLLPDAGPLVQRTVLGYSALNLIFAFAYRNSLPPYAPWFVIGALCIRSFASIGHAATRTSLRRFFNLERPNYAFFFVLLSLAPYVCIAYFPWLNDSAVFFSSIDPPDLNGFAAGFLKDGGDWRQLQILFKEAAGHARWWEPVKDHWTLADYRGAVALDTLVLLLRWGHAAVAAQMSWVTDRPIWFGVFVATALPFFLCPVIVMDACRARGASAPVACVLTVCAAGTAGSLLWNEGLFAHIAATPILTLIMLHFVAFSTKCMRLGQRLSLACLLSTLVITWSDSIAILVVLASILITISFISPLRTGICSGALLTHMVACGVLCVAIAPQFIAGFVLIYLGRLAHGFSPGILTAGWSLAGILLPFPIISIRGPETPGIALLFSAGLGHRLAEIICLLALGAFLFARRCREGIELIVVALTAFVFTVGNQPYVFWNTIITIQPSLIINTFFALPERVAAIRRGQAAIVYALAMVVTQWTLQHQYGLHATPIHARQFDTDFSLAVSGKRFAYLTPTLASGYQRLGWHGELYWANRRRSWEDRFVTYRGSAETDRLLYLYFDRDVEGTARCDAIMKATGGRLREKQVLPTTTTIGSLLDHNGMVDKGLLDALIVKEFGVQPRHTEFPPYY